MAIKYINWQYYIPKGHKIYQPFPIQGAPKIFPNQDFWFENRYTIWQPWHRHKNEDEKNGYGEEKIRLLTSIFIFNAIVQSEQDFFKKMFDFLLKGRPRFSFFPDFESFFKFKDSIDFKTSKNIFYNFCSLSHN
jgi:hypothetical protein